MKLQFMQRVRLLLMALMLLLSPMMASNVGYRAASRSDLRGKIDNINNFLAASVHEDEAELFLMKCPKPNDMLGVLDNINTENLFFRNGLTRMRQERLNAEYSSSVTDYRASIKLWTEGEYADFYTLVVGMPEKVAAASAECQNLEDALKNASTNEELEAIGTQLNDLMDRINRDIMTLAELVSIENAIGKRVDSFYADAAHLTTAVNGRVKEIAATLTGAERQLYDVKDSLWVTFFRLDNLLARIDTVSIDDEYIAAYGEEAGRALDLRMMRAARLMEYNDEAYYHEEISESQFNSVTTRLRDVSQRIYQRYTISSDESEEEMKSRLKQMKNDIQVKIYGCESTVEPLFGNEASTEEERLAAVARVGMLTDSSMRYIQKVEDLYMWQDGLGVFLAEIDSLLDTIQAELDEAVSADIGTITTNGMSAVKVWTLDGKPTTLPISKKGVYIIGGKKVVVK